MADCTVHLICLQQGVTPKEFLTQVKGNGSQYLIKGVPHGWVHRPHELDKQHLTEHDWNLFLVTDASANVAAGKSYARAHISIDVSIPQAQYKHIKSSISTVPKPSRDTPPLTGEWAHSGRIPPSALVEAKQDQLGVGELRLDHAMADYLSTSLPRNVTDAPASFFNLFYYKGSRDVHDDYMNGFRENFGSAAGASVKFMGPVTSDLRFEGGDSNGASNRKRWEDANLVQYDSVWHYAYMLSTSIYKELNKQKVAGLDDTCILLVSEMELFE